MSAAFILFTLKNVSMNTKIKRFELVEMTIPAGTTGRVNFQTIPQLRNQANQTISIKSIMVYTVDSYANSQVTNSIPGFPLAEILKCVLVLYVNGEESVKMVPLAQLINIQGTAGIANQMQITPFDDLTNVDFDKSYVQFNAAAANTPYVIPFGITYLRWMKDPSTGNMVQG
jgi:hypothetical protein